MMAVDFRRAANSRGLSCPEIAAATGYSPRTILSYWHGERSVPPGVEEFLLTGIARKRPPRPRATRLYGVGPGPAPRDPLSGVRKAVTQAVGQRNRALAAIAKMCAWCEPDSGGCWEPKCPLRPWRA